VQELLASAPGDAGDLDKRPEHPQTAEKRIDESRKEDPEDGSHHSRLPGSDPLDEVERPDRGLQDEDADEDVSDPPDRRLRARIPDLGVHPASQEKCAQDERQTEVVLPHPQTHLRERGRPKRTPNVLLDPDLLVERTVFSRRPDGHESRVHHQGGVMSDGMRDKVEGKLKETEGELTDDTMREKQGEAQQKWGDTKDKAEDVKDKVDDRV
jgi:uncharacterized protein YjbJ (UPF0337 family)